MPCPYQRIYIIIKVKWYKTPEFRYKKIYLAIPSTFKAYIDQIVRPRRTFVFEPEDGANPYKGRVLGKKMFLIAARGGSGFGSGGQYEKLNYQTPYLATVFGFIGITDITFIDIENDESGGQKLADAIANACTQVAKLVAR